MQWLRDHEHDAIHLLDEGLERLDDRAISTRRRGESRVLLTFDLDFTEIVSASGGKAVSLISFRVRRPRVQHVVQRLAQCLAELGAEIDGAPQRLPPAARDLDRGEAQKRSQDNSSRSSEYGRGSSFSSLSRDIVARRDYEKLNKTQQEESMVTARTRWRVTGLSKTEVSHPVSRQLPARRRHRALGGASACSMA